MKRATVTIKNLMYRNNSKIYESYKGKFIVCSFSMSLNPSANYPEWEIISINSILYNNLTNVLNISSDRFTSDDMVTGTPILKDSTLDRIISSFDSSYINYYIYNNKLYLYTLFSIDSEGNVLNSNFVDNGLIIEMNIPDNTNSLVMVDVNYQGIPYKQGCPNVLISKSDVIVLIS